MLERTTQPMTDAVIERPLTLVEKLRNTPIFDFSVKDRQTY